MASKETSGAPAEAGQSQEIVVPQHVIASSLEIAQLDKLDEILLTGDFANAPVVEEDPDEVSRRIVAELLSAKTDEELEAFGAATGWRELEGVPMEIHSFNWRPSALEDGAPIFFVVKATNMATGEQLTLTCGSLNVMAQLSNLARRGRLQGAVRELVKAPKTKAGFHPLWLRTPESIKKAQSEQSAAA